MNTEEKAKIKAKEIFEKMKGAIAMNTIALTWNKTGSDDYKYEIPLAASACATACVDEILVTLSGVWADVAATTNRSCEDTLKHQSFFRQVKQEIENL